MEEFLDAVTGGAIWGIGFGLAIGAVRVAGASMRPVAKGMMRSTLAVTDWARGAAEEGRETLQDIYHEAKAERRTQAAQA
jgi:hypothetical protein